MAGEDASDASVLQAARKKCWLARDAYYACVDSGSAFPCWRSRRAFTAACPAAWVKHFDNKREERERVAKTLQLITQPRFSKPQPPEQPAGTPP